MRYLSLVLFCLINAWPNIIISIRSLTLPDVVFLRVSLVSASIWFVAFHLCRTGRVRYLGSVAVVGVLSFIAGVLPQALRLPADLWINTIAYVGSVLAATAILAWTISFALIRRDLAQVQADSATA
jgi:hypothetical protein